MKKTPRLILALVFVGSLIGGGIVTELRASRIAEASRNSSGTYTLPTPGVPFQPRTTISSSQMNTTLTDLGAEMTNSLDRLGRGGMSAPLLIVSGAMGAPGLTWVGNTSSGLYKAATNDIRMSIGGADAMRWSTVPGSSVTLTANGLNQNGLSATGNGTGSGLVGTGGASSGAVGVSGTGGASNGIGGNFTGVGSGAGVVGTSASGIGGNFTGGTNNIGVQATGNGTGTGASFTGGATNGLGAVIAGGGTSGVGLNVTSTGTATAANFTAGTGVANGIVVTGGGAGGIAGDFNGSPGVRAQGGITIGTTGTNISASYRGTSAITGASQPANSCGNFTFTVTGAVTGAECVTGTPATATTSLIYTCFITSANTCNLSICNPTTGAISFITGTYSCRAFNP